MVPTNEICPKCGNRGVALLYCAGGAASVVGCVEKRADEHLHIDCATCRHRIRVRECDDAQ